MRDAGGMPFALVTELVEWVEPFFSTFGYLIVSVAMFFESAALTGVVVPGDVILAVGGVYAGQGELQLAGVILAGSFFGLLGETTGYLLGRRYGDGWLRRAPILGRFQDRLTELQDGIRANAGKTIVVGRFVTGAAGLIPFIAGSSGIRPRTFFAYSVPTIVLWATGVSLLGFFIGNHVETIDKILSRVGWIGLALVVLFVSLWIWRRRRTPKEGADDRAGSTIDDE
jgi:membrane-associated protein